MYWKINFQYRHNKNDQSLETKTNERPSLGFLALVEIKAQRIKSDKNFNSFSADLPNERPAKKSSRTHLIFFSDKESSKESGKNHFHFWVNQLRRLFARFCRRD